MDEWDFHTPAILNEALRAHRFEVQSSALGNHSVALIGNVPVAHISTIFRPQFWGFFVLPVDYAFAVYWQFKALLLLTGLFTWLLLLTHSTLCSITGALWYFFSAYTQWSYSWPSLLPEMVGLICFVMVCACYLTIGRNAIGLALAALAGATCAINFGMCAYLPQLFPLAELALFFFAAWCIAKRELIFRGDGAGLRMLCATLSIALIAVIGIVVFLQLRTAIAGIANTTYPGKRVFAGASASPQVYISHFLNWKETETHVPAQLPNICEASGFLWLAPVTLFCIGRLMFSRLQKFAFATLWCWSLIMLGWLLFPIPGRIGKFLGLTLTGATRSDAALGLANIAIVMLCVACIGKRNGGFSRWTAGLASAASTLGIFGVIFTLVFLTNGLMSGFFSLREMLFAAAFATAAAMLILEGRKALFACLLVVPLAVKFGGVNPIERGVTVFTNSKLYSFVHADKALLESEWIVFSEEMHSPEFLGGVGCQVYNGLHYLPDIDHFALFRSAGWDIEAAEQGRIPDCQSVKCECEGLFGIRRVRHSSLACESVGRHP